MSVRFATNTHRQIYSRWLHFVSMRRTTAGHSLGIDFKEVWSSLAKSCNMPCFGSEEGFKAGSRLSDEVQTAEGLHQPNAFEQ